MNHPELHHVKLESRGKGIALICECCSYPFAHIRLDRLFISSKHGIEHHLNWLTADDLRKLADFLEEKGAKMREEKAA